jgi:hypothetical protein
MMKHCLALGTAVVMGAVISTAVPAAPISPAATAGMGAIHSRVPSRLGQSPYCKSIRKKCERSAPPWYGSANMRLFNKCMRLHGCAKGVW